jgi:hypothetical protein
MPLDAGVKSECGSRTCEFAASETWVRAAAQMAVLSQTDRWTNERILLGWFVLWKAARSRVSLGRWLFGSVAEFVGKKAGRSRIVYRRAARARARQPPLCYF